MVARITTTRFVITETYQVLNFQRLVYHVSLARWQESSLCLVWPICLSVYIVTHMALRVDSCTKYRIEVIILCLRPRFSPSMLNDKLSSLWTLVLSLELRLCILVEESLTCLVHDISGRAIHHVEMRCILFAMLDHIDMRSLCRVRRPCLSVMSICCTRHGQVEISNIFIVLQGVPVH